MSQADTHYDQNVSLLYRDLPNHGNDSTIEGCDSALVDFIANLYISAHGYAGLCKMDVVTESNFS
jgi:hypothetical protein